MKSTMKTGAFMLMAVVATLAIYRIAGGGEAPIPAMFDHSLTLADAKRIATKDNKIVLALATASWCGPCQSYKRGALSDDRVTAWAQENAVPVYIDVDEHKEEAMALGVSSIPATFLIRGDHIVGKIVGATSADQLLAWLDTNAGATP